MIVALLLIFTPLLLEPDGMVVRQIWAPAKGISGAPSPDGRYLSFTDWETGDLAVRDLTNGTNRRLTEKGTWSESGEFAYFHVWSPNGQEIATSWWLPEENQFDLRIVPVDGGDPRVIYFDKEHYVHPKAWSADGQHIVIVREGASDHIVQLVMISTADGKARVLKSLDWNWPSGVSISPDGRYVVYDMPQEDGSQECDIFILATDGSSESTLVEHPGHDGAPCWAPDGKHVVFTSDRNGSLHLWVLPVKDGRPDGFPRPVGVDMNRMRPLGISQDGTYFYLSDNSGRNDNYVAKLDPMSGEVAERPTKITRRYEGFNSRPAWSPDGKHLAYVSDRGLRNSSSLIIRSVESGEERVLRPRLDGLIFLNTRLHWSPDGESILLSEGRDEKSRWGIYAVDAKTGDVTPLIPPTNDYNSRPSAAAWSSDGKTIYYIHNTYHSNTFVASIVAYRPATSEQKTLHKSTGSRRPNKYQPPKLYHSLAVSPDGSLLAIAGRKAISVMPASGGMPRVVHNLDQDDIPVAVGIVWARNSRSIIFGTAQVHPGSDRLPQKNTRLWQVSIADGATRELGLALDFLAHIAMHPDGQKIAYTTQAPELSRARAVWTVENFLSPLDEAN